MKPSLKEIQKWKEERISSQVEKKRMVTCILTKDGSLNLRETEKRLKQMFFDELGEVVKVRIRR